MIKDTFANIMKQLGCDDRDKYHVTSENTTRCSSCGHVSKRNIFNLGSRCVLMSFRIAGEDVWACFVRRDCNKCHKPGFHRISTTVQCGECFEALRLEMPVFSREHQSGTFSRVDCGSWGGPTTYNELEIPS